MVFTPKVLRLVLARRSLAKFAKLLMPAFETAPVHGIIIQYLEKLLSGEISKLAIVTPPRHGKSLLGSVFTPAFALGRNPLETIIQVSYGSDLAEGFGRRVRNILLDPTFQEIFPGCKLSPDSAAVYRFETSLGGEYSAIGRSGVATGRGASLLILDDLIKDAQEANSEATCRSVIEWLQSVAFTVVNLPALAEAGEDPLGRSIGQALCQLPLGLQFVQQFARRLSGGVVAIHLDAACPYGRLVAAAGHSRGVSSCFPGALRYRRDVPRFQKSY